MPRRLPLHVERNHVKGKTYLSFRLDKGPRIRLPDDPTSDEFRTAYQAALLGQAAPTRDRFQPATHGSIAALVVSYQKSGEYISLRDTTKKGYRTRIEVLRNQHGQRSVTGLTRERIVTGIMQPYADRPGAALSILKMLRVLIRHAINIGWLKHDPSLGIKRPKIKKIRSWTDKEIEQFKIRWPLGTKQRTAFHLFLNLGQRRSDVVRMAQTHLTLEGKIRITQQKTGRDLLIPLHRDTVEALEAFDMQHVVIITTAYGKPFTVDGFSGWMRDAISEAGLPLDCKPHGLRKAAGRLLAEAGATAKMIMSILGHTTLAEAERYTEEADQAGLAEDAVAKLEGHKANKSPQTTVPSLGTRPKSLERSK
jgi:integrase